MKGLVSVRTARTARAGVRLESGRIMPIPLVTAIVALIILGLLHREKRSLRGSSIRRASDAHLGCRAAVERGSAPSWQEIHS